MSTLSAYADPGIFTPEDLSLLQEVFDEVCRTLHVATDGHEAEAIAKQLILAFRTGIWEKEILFRMLTSRNAA